MNNKPCVLCHGFPECLPSCVGHELGFDCLVCGRPANGLYRGEPSCKIGRCERELRGQGTIKFCECTQCGERLLGDSPANLQFAEGFYDSKNCELVAARVLGHPYCRKCLRVKRPNNSSATMDPDPSPYQENAIRDMEDGYSD